MKFLLATLAMFLLLSDASAQNRRSRYRPQPQQYSNQTNMIVGSTMLSAPGDSLASANSSLGRSTGASYTGSAAGADDAMEELNAYRTARGLRPLINDPLLNKAALACAKQRAARGIHGHLPESDFSYLPSGAQATSAGCGALEPSWGWATCCMDDRNITYAGAAWVMGSDGRRYMHMFCR